MAAQLDEGQENGKKMIRAAIDDLQKSQHSVNVIDEVTKAKKENVLFQMESIYRERLVEAYRKVNVLII